MEYNCSIILVFAVYGVFDILKHNDLIIIIIYGGAGIYKGFFGLITVGTCEYLVLIISPFGAKNSEFPIWLTFGTFVSILTITGSLIPPSLFVAVAFNGSFFVLLTVFVDTNGFGFGLFSLLHIY